MKIKNCPFCGSFAYLDIKYDSDENRPDGYQHFVSCDNCGAKGSSFYAVEVDKIHLTKKQKIEQDNIINNTKIDAIKAWNKRSRINYDKKTN